MKEGEIVCLTRTETDINLIKPLDAAIVAAKLIVGVTIDEIDEIDEAVGLWFPYLTQQLRMGGVQPQHAHWEWSRKVRAVRGMISYVFCGITVAGEMQALALREDTFARAKHPIRMECLSSISLSYPLPLGTTETSRQHRPIGDVEAFSCGKP